MSGMMVRMPPRAPATKIPARSTRRSTAQRTKPTEIGASGLKVAGGRVNEEFLPLLRGDKGVRMWREMGDNDPYSGALLYGVMQMILRCDWSVDDNGGKQGDAEFLEQCRDDMAHPFRDVVAEALTCGQYGWALLEPVMKWRNGPDAAEGEASDYDDGRLGWAKMALRAQETLFKWTFDPESGDAIAMQQRLIASDATNKTTVDIPFTRALLFRTTHHKNSPEGRSLLRSGWVPYDKRKKIEVYEGIGIERDNAGIPVFYIPSDMMAEDASPDKKAAVAEFHRIGRNLRMDDQSHLVMPQEYDDNGNQLYDFELASTNARRMIDTNTVINRLAVAQLMSIMADVMMVGHEGDSGSRALASIKDDAFTAGLQALADEVRDVLNMNAIPRLMRLNGIAPPFPKFTISPVQRVDPMEFTKLVLQLAQSGMPLWPDDDLDEYIREVLGWPARSNDGLGMDLQTTPGLDDNTDDPAEGDTIDANSTVVGTTVDDGEQGAAPRKRAAPRTARGKQPAGKRRGAAADRKAQMDQQSKPTPPAQRAKSGGGTRTKANA